MKIYGPAGADATGRGVLFIRNVASFQGGHLKVWDYFNHVREAQGFVPHITFGRDTVWDERNPWSLDALQRVRKPRIDVVFVGGMGWDAIPRRYANLPVVNLIQHVRHGDPNDPRVRFLERRAVRICVSPEVADAVSERANGPVLTIPDAIDVAGLQREHRSDGRPVDLVVVANKQPDMGRIVAERAAAENVRVIDSFVPRRELLDTFASARVAVFVPNPTEGFYLPALEAMALGALVVCPDVVGNRSFCVPRRTAFRPSFDTDDIAARTNEALALDAQGAAEMVRAGLAMAAEHDLPKERERFHDVLAKLDELWTT